MKNTTFSNEEKQIFYGNYPLVVQSLPLKTSVTAGNIVGVSTNGDYGLYDGTTYSEPYAIAHEDVTYTDREVNCECILSAYLMKDFVKMSGGESDKRKLIQMLKKQGIFLR